MDSVEGVSHHQTFSYIGRCIWLFTHLGSEGELAFNS
jgi:hypothetical protein